MAIKNPTDFLVQATKLPVAIEGVLPAGAPKISTTLVDVATKLPQLPDFPIEIPDLPDLPALALPMAPGLRYVTQVEVRPTEMPAPKQESVVDGGKIIEGRGF